MNHIHNGNVDNIAQCNILHDILSPSEGIKYMNTQYSPIIHGKMNTRWGRSKYKNS